MISVNTNSVTTYTEFQEFYMALAEDIRHNKMIVVDSLNYDKDVYERRYSSFRNLTSISYKVPHDYNMHELHMQLSADLHVGRFMLVDKQNNVLGGSCDDIVICMHYEFDESSYCSICPVIVIEWERHPEQEKVAKITNMTNFISHVAESLESGKEVTIICGAKYGGIPETDTWYHLSAYDYFVDDSDETQNVYYIDENIDLEALAESIRGELYDDNLYGFDISTSQLEHDSIIHEHAKELIIYHQAEVMPKTKRARK